MQNELRKKVRQIQRIRSTLTSKQDVINSTRVTHSSCSAILADYHKVKYNLKSTQTAKESAEAQTRDAESRIKKLEEQLADYEQLRADLKSTQVAKESAESQAREAELRVNQLEESKRLTPYNISSVLQGVFCVYIVGIYV